jgi:tetratricopeptide (TPR) repeat protein
MNKKDSQKKIEEKVFDAIPIHELQEEEEKRHRAYGTLGRRAKSKGKAKPRIKAKPLGKRFFFNLGVAVFVLGMVLGWVAKELLLEKGERITLSNRFSLRTELDHISFTVKPIPTIKGRTIPGRRIALKKGERISVKYGKEELLYSNLVMKKSLWGLFSEEPKLFLDSKITIEFRKDIIAFTKPEEKTHYLIEVKKDALSKPLGKIHIDLKLKPADWIARAKAIKGNPEGQKVCYQNALKGSPGNNKLLIIYGEFLAGAGDLKEAESMFRRALKEDQKDVSALKGLVSIYSSRQPKKALTLYERLLRLDPSNRLTYYRKIASAQERLGLDQTATFKKILEIDGKDKVALRGLEAKYQDIIQRARRAQKRGRFLEAIDLVRRARQIRKNKSNTKYLATLLNNYGFDRSETKAYAKAISLYKESIRLNPHPTTYLNMAVSYDSLGNVKAAIQALEKANALKPRDAKTQRDILVFWARLLERKKAYQGAMGLYQKSIKVYPKDREALIALGMLYFKKKGYNDALDYLNKATALSPQKKAPEDAEIYKLIGELYWRKGRTTKKNKEKIELYTLALNAYDNALSIKKDDKEVRQRSSELAQERMALKIKMLKDTQE